MEILGGRGRMRSTDRNWVARILTEIWFNKSHAEEPQRSIRASPGQKYDLIVAQIASAKHGIPRWDHSLASVPTLFPSIYPWVFKGLLGWLDMMCPFMGATNSPHLAPREKVWKKRWVSINAILDELWGQTLRCIIVMAKNENENIATSSYTTPLLIYDPNVSYLRVSYLYP